ncbi:hypothetical protein [Sphingopyxis sp. 113P3]|uniref:hypothetical protein n=1 Tax=Sphingopyxis sp. (strain 113P3) TaxID=292913 RepID=UPI0006AD4751|nr:hypothetical protein [Sphingopyxis sp. 113P3]ALC11493.1 hypothetical protein LH20_05950 [Sphingopyxis sp. 113P3]
MIRSPINRPPRRGTFAATGAMLALLLAAPVHSSESGNDVPADGWGYLHAQCMQERVAEPRNICEVELNDEPVLAIIVSNIVRLDEKSFDPYARFTAELKRLHGLDMEPREAGPIANWEFAEAAQVEAMRITRRVEKGKVAFLALSLEPERLADEPNAEEMERMPPPLPSVAAAWQDETLTVWRTDTACGLRDKDGNETLPPLVIDPFGEAGEGCPFQVASGHGLYAFHVERSGTICGEKGVCTEIYGPDANQMLVADYSPNLLTVHRGLHNLGLLVTGDRVQRLWSFPERRYISGALPFFDLGPDERVLVGDTTIRHNRVAVPFERHRSPATEPFADTADEYALFFLDTRRFEDVVLADPLALATPAEPPAFTRYEAEAIEPCAHESAWLLSADRRAEQYLKNSYYEFDKHFRAFTGSLARDIDVAKADPARATRIAERLDALMPRLARLLTGVAAPADSLAVARISGSFEFQSPEGVQPGDGHTAWLRAALAEEMVLGEDRAAADEAGERIDAFLTSLGKLRYGLRRLEARTDGRDRDADLAALHGDAQALVRNWRDGFDPALKQALFDAEPSLAERLHRRIRAMCPES